MELLTGIFNSFLSLPLWVQVWVCGILVQVNVGAIAFLGEDYGKSICALAMLGMAPNLVLLLYGRGVTDSMAVSHTVFWLPLCGLLLFRLNASNQEPNPTYRRFLWILLLCNAFSLLFDTRDTYLFFTS